MRLLPASQRGACSLVFADRQVAEIVKGWARAADTAPTTETRLEPPRRTFSGSVAL